MLPSVLPSAWRQTCSGKKPRSHSAPKNSDPPRASVGMTTTESGSFREMYTKSENERPPSFQQTRLMFDHCKL